jgi:hypothetical protein
MAVLIFLAVPIALMGIGVRATPKNPRRCRLGGPDAGWWAASSSIGGDQFGHHGTSCGGGGCGGASG